MPKRSKKSLVFILAAAGIALAAVQSFAAAPIAVTTLSGLPGAYAGQVDLNWSMPGDDDVTPLSSGSQFRIQHSTQSTGNPPGDWSYTFAQTIVSTSGVTPGTNVRYTITGLSEGDTYYFMIWHANASLEWSGLSNPATSWALSNTGVAVSTGNAGSARSIVRDSSGNLYYAYTKQVNSFSRVFVAKSSDNGEHWADTPGGSPSAGLDTYNQYAPSLVIDAYNRIHCVWYGSDGSQQKIWYSYSNDGGNYWFPRGNISDSGLAAHNPCLVVDSKNILHCFWSTDTSDIWFSSSTAGTNTWSLQSVAVSVAGYPQYFPCAAVDRHDNIHLVWSGRDGTSASNTQIKYAMRGRDAGTWNTPVKIATINGYDQNKPCVVVDTSSVLHCVWSGMDASYPAASQIKHSSSTITSGVWSPVKNIQPIAGVPQTDPVVAVDSAGIVHCAWVGKDTSAAFFSQIKYSKLSDGAWSSWTNLSRGGAMQVMPSMRWSGWYNNEGNLNIGWFDAGGSKVRMLSDYAVLMSTGFIKDAIQPAAISSLRAVPGSFVGSIALDWTSPGNDNLSGNLSGKYYIQFSTYQYESWMWQNAQIVLSTSNASPLSPMSFTIGGLDPGTTYYFSVAAADDADNISPLSNYATSWALLPAAGADNLASFNSGGDGWQGTFNGASNDNDACYAVANDNMGNVYAAGNTVDGGISLMMVRKYTADGALAWAKYYNSPGNTGAAARGVAYDTLFNVLYVAGEVDMSAKGQGTDLLLRKYDSNGTLLWTRTYDDPNHDVDKGNGVAVDMAGNVYVTGYETRADLSQDENLFVKKYNPDGYLQWTATGSFSTTDKGFAVATDISNNVFVTGVAATAQPGVWTLKYDMWGNLLWANTYYADGALGATGFGIDVDAAGDVYVAGHEDRSGQSKNIWVGKYAGADGYLVWTSTFNGADNGGDEGWAVSAQNGGVYVAGYVTSAGQAQDVWAGKFKADSGLLQWATSYAGSGAGADAGCGISVISSNVYVGGYAVSGSAADLWLRKYVEKLPEGVPSGLWVSTKTAGSLKWAWMDNVSNETGYRVKLSSVVYAPSTLSLSGDLPPDTTYWVMPGLLLNTSYQAYVEAFTFWGSTPSMSAVSATLGNPPSAVNFPAVNIASVTISFDFNENTPGTTYYIQRSSDNDHWDFIGSTTTSPYVDTAGPIESNTRYYYRLQSMNQSYEFSDYSDVVSTWTLARPPMSLWSNSAEHAQVSLSWSVGGMNPWYTEYSVERSTWNGGFALVSATTAETFVDAALMESATYWYRVRAVNEAGVYTDYAAEISTYCFVERIAPTVAISTPSHHQFINNLAQIIGTCEDNVQVSSVVFTLRELTTGYYLKDGLWDSTTPQWLVASIEQSTWSYATGAIWVSGSSYTIVAKAMDNSYNWSTEYATATFTFDNIWPEQITSFAAHQGADANTLRLSWKAPGSDYTDQTKPLGPGSEYVIEYSTDSTFIEGLQQVIISTQGVPPGTIVSTTVTPSLNAMYYFRIMAIDEAKNWWMWASTAAYNSPFSFETVDAGPDFGQAPSICADKDGNLHVAYLDRNGNQLRYIKRTGASWGSPVVIAPAEPAGYHISLAVDGSGHPRIAFQNPYDSSDLLKYVSYDGVAWSSSTVDAGAGVGKSASLAIDGKGLPHIAYMGTNELKYARFDGTAWSTATVDAAGVADVKCSLALDAAGNPRISYYKSPADALWYAHAETGTWTTAMVELSAGFYNALALDGAGNPHIAYYRSGDWVKYTWFDGAAWHPTNVDMTSGNQQNLPLALDGDGNPSIAYYDMNTQSLKYARHDGTNWLAGAVVDSSKAGDFATLAIDAAGSVHIAYRDEQNTDLKVAHWTTANLPAPMSGSAGGKTQAPAGLAAVATTENSIEWQWTANSSNESGFRVYSATTPWAYTLLADSTTLPAGTYTWVEGSLAPNTAYTNYVAAVNDGGVVTSSPTTAWTRAEQPGVDGLTDVSANSIRATWNTGNNPGLTGYYVECSSTSGFAPALSNSGWLAATNIPFGALEPNTTYYFRVKARNEEYVETDWTVLGATSTLAAQPVAAPAGPGSANAITVNWTSTNPSWTSFTAECSSVAAGVQVLGTSTTINSFAQFSGLDPNTTYYFNVRAVNNGNIATDWTTLASTHTHANVPGDIVVGDVGISSVTLSWASNANPDYTLYNLEVSTGAPGMWTDLVLSTNMGFVHEGLDPDTTYFYRVEALNLDGIETNYTEVQSTWTRANPAGGISFSGYSNTGVSVSWIGTNQSYTTYEVACSTGDADDFGVVGTAAGNGPFIHAGLTPNTTYFYRVYAKNLGGQYAAYTESSCVTLCSQPEGIQYSLIRGTHVTVGWSVSSPDNPPNTMYAVIFATAADSPPFMTGFTVHGAAEANVTGLSVNTTYYVTVVATNWQGQQASNQAGVNWVSTYCEYPNNLVWGAHTSSSVAVSWTDDTANPANTIYHLIVSTSPDGLPSAGSSETVKGAGQAMVAGLAANTSYYASVMAENWQNQGFPTQIMASTVTSANPPVGAAVTAYSSSTVTLEWQRNDNPLYTAWEIIRSPDNFTASTTTLVDFTDGYTAISFNDTSVSNSTTYYYKVRACNLAGEPSAYDAAAGVLTSKGPAAQLLVLVPGETFAEGAAPGKTGVPQQQAAGAAFTVTALALDSNYYYSETATPLVTVGTSDDYDTEPAPVSLIAGSATVTVTLITAGTAQITASAGGLTSNTTAVFVLPAPAARLLVLAPGESALPGSPSGKTGVPSLQTAGAAFATTVELVDVYWNKSNSTETVVVTLNADDPYAPVLTAQPLQNSATIFSATLITASTAGWQLTAADVDGTGPLYAAHVSSSVPVAAGAGARLLVTMPNETYVPGSPTGKSGAPQSQYTGVPFTVTVRATDMYNNIQASSNPVVVMTTSDPGDSEPSPAALSGGVGTFSIIFATEQNNWTACATDNAAGLLSSTGTAVYAFDGIRPDAVSGLTAAPGAGHATINLTWTAPGDNLMEGDITGGSFVIRYSSTQITDFDAPPAPYYEITITTSVTAGSPQSRLVTNLPYWTTYYFAIRAYDEAANTSTWSTAGVNIQNRALSPDTELPVITNSQPSDTAWRNADPGAVFDVNFADYYSCLSTITYQVHTLPGLAGTALVPPTGIAAVAGAQYYTAGWGLNFPLLADGQNYITVTAQDLAGNTSTWIDAFYVLKDTTPPTQPFCASPADGATSADMQFNWSISNDAMSGMAAANRYQIEIALDAACSAIMASSTTMTTTIALPGLSGGQRWWRVRSLDAAGNYSLWSATFAVSIVSTIPSDPTTLAAVAVSSTAIQWNWLDTSDNESGFKLYSTFGGAINIGAANTTYYVETSLTPNIAKSRYVVAYNLINESAGGTNTVARYTLSNPPAAPVISHITSTSMNLSWDTNSNPAGTLYSVERAADDAFTAPTFCGSTAATYYMVTGLSPESTYYLRVQSQNGDGMYSAFASSVSAVTLIPPPAGPSGFSGTALSTDSICWAWTDTSSTEDGFSVYSSTGGFIDSIAANTSYYVEIGLTANGLYSRHVKTFNIAGESAASNVAAVYALANAPVNLASSAQTSSNISLSWSAGEGGSTKYYLERSSDGVTFAALADNVTAAAYTDTGLNSDTTYYYRVAGYNGGGIRTAASDSVAVKTAYVPPQILAGMVTTASGAPITGVEITASKLSSNISYAVNTSTGGAYVVTLEPAIADGLYRVKASWTANNIVSSVYKENIANGQDKVNFTLEVDYELATVSGQVMIIKNAQSSSRALARALGIAGSSPAFVELMQNNKVIARVATDDQGAYTVPNLLPGTYSIRAYNGVAYSNATVVHLKEGSSVSVTFSYELLNHDKVYAYPNPAASVGSAVIHFETSGQDIDAQLNIYTISGELVRSVAAEDIKSAANVWEYTWDLTNAGGEKVASGVFLFQVRVKDTKTNEYATVTKKLAVVR